MRPLIRPTQLITAEQGLTRGRTLSRVFTLLPFCPCVVLPDRIGPYVHHSMVYKFPKGL